MQIAHLRTLVALQDSGSLTAASKRVHLSHSAVSIQMKHLEHELGIELFIPGRRPATLTSLGEEIASDARGILESIDALKTLAGTDNTTGHVTLGFVPTTLETLLPIALERLQAGFPDLMVNVRSGLSTQLAAAVEAGELDFAILSAPVSAYPGIRLFEIGSEPLFLVTAKGNRNGTRIDDILRRNPYIAFNRETGLGGEITGYLARLGHPQDPAIELDSIDAIEALVARDFGVSIVPRRLLAPPLENSLRCISLGSPSPSRSLVLASSRHCRRLSVQETLAGIVSG